MTPCYGQGHYRSLSRVAESGNHLFYKRLGIRPTIKSDDILMLLGFVDIENFVVRDVTD